MATLAALRPSCAAAAERAHLRIDRAAVDRFLRGIDKSEYEVLCKQHGLSFPLRFASLADEVNFVAVLALLNAFSGYRVEFHRTTGHGAYDCIRRILLGLYLSESDAPLGTDALANVSASQLAEILGVPTHTEAPHPKLPFVTVGTVGGPLHEPLSMAARACNDVAAFLRSARAASLGTYLLAACADAAVADDADSYLLEVIASVPGFDDAADIDGERILIMKKALFLLNALRMRLASDLPIEAPRGAQALAARWRTVPPAPLPMFVDNVLPTMLLHLGVLDASESGITALAACSMEPADGDAPGPLLSREDAYRVRAATLYAGSQIVARAAELAAERPWLATLTETDLDGYLWSIAKKDELRRIPRLAERHTCMY